MRHEILGELSPEEAFPEARRGEVRYAGRSLRISIDPDGRPLEVAIELASTIVRSVREYDAAGKTIIARDLRATYNNAWNESGDLSEGEFKSRFSLDAIKVIGPELVELWYRDSGLFEGHSVLVSSLDGADFSGARAELFG